MESVKCKTELKPIVQPVFESYLIPLKLAQMGCILIGFPSVGIVMKLINMYDIKKFAEFQE